MKFRKTVLSASIVAAMDFTAAAHAQQPAASASDMEEIVVTGIRASLARSLDAKKAAAAHVDIISAEDIGKMPDKNIADSLQRVPGVTISAASANEGAFDENDRVSMRGTSPSFTQTLVNGHNIATGDWFVLNQTGTVGRSVSYSLLPSELVDQIVVHKAYEARLVEGGLTGSVDIITRSPLKFEEGVTVLGSAGGVYSELPDENDPQLSGLVNWRNSAGTFGVLVQAFSEERHLRRDGQEILGYGQIAGTSAAALAHPELAGVYFPSLIGSALFEQKRERQGGQFTVEFRPAEGVDLSLTGFTSELEADNYNRNYMLWGSNIINSGAVPDDGFVVRDNTLVSANFSPDPANPTRAYGIYDMISRPNSKSSSEFVNLDGSWEIDDNWTISGQLGTSEGHGETPTQDVAEMDVGIGTGAQWNLNGVGAADWSLGATNTAQPGTVGTDVRLNWIFGYQDIDVLDEEDWQQLDAVYKLDSGVLQSIEFGVRNAEHTRELDEATAQGPGCLGANPPAGPLSWEAPYNCPAGTQSPWDPANFPQGHGSYPGDFASDLGGSFPDNIWFFSPGQLADFNRLAFRDPVVRFDYSGAYALEEQSSAAYTQFNFAGERWTANLGVRYVMTKEDITNYVNAPNDPDAITTSAFGPFKAVKTDHEYNDWLPTANIKFEVRDDMVLRASATRSMTRPDYSALAGSVNLSPTLQSGTGGNPDLKPVKSNNLDLAWEWYYDTRALVSASVFYMDIEDYVSIGQTTKSFFTFDAQNPQGAYVDYVLSVPVNSDAEVKGIELDWQQPIGQYFGVFANYTWADGDTDDGTPMLGTSEDTYNLGTYFETKKFNARIAYNFRSSFYSGLDRNTAFFQDDVESLDASVGYQITENFGISADARNLSDEEIKYYADSSERPRSIYRNGRQYYLNLRFNF